MIQTAFLHFIKHAVLPKRDRQGNDTFVGRVDLLVTLIVLMA